MARKQCPASVMVWAVVTEFRRSSLFFVDQGVKLKQQNYRDDILVGALCPWVREHFKTIPGLSAGLCTITWGQKHSRVAFRECSALHYQRGMSPIFLRFESFGFWDLVKPGEQRLDCLLSKFGNPISQTAEGVGQNSSENHS